MTAGPRSRPTSPISSPTFPWTATTWARLLPLPGPAFPTPTRIPPPPHPSHQLLQWKPGSPASFLLPRSPHPAPPRDMQIPPPKDVSPPLLLTPWPSLSRRSPDLLTSQPPLAPHAKLSMASRGTWGELPDSSPSPTVSVLCDGRCPPLRPFSGADQPRSAAGPLRVPAGTSPRPARSSSAGHLP